MYDREGLKDQILLEQFLGDLEDNTQCWMRCYLHQYCEEAMRLVEAFAVSERDYVRDWANCSTRSSNPQEDERCHDPSQHRPRKVICYKCGKIAHIGKECRSYLGEQ